MENKFKPEEIEQNLFDHLSKTQLNKNELSGLSKQIASLNKLGFKIVDWSIYGKPAFERFVLEAQLPADKKSSFQNLLTTNNFKEIFILKKGIPVPDFFNVKITIDNVQN